MKLRIQHIATLSALLALSATNSLTSSAQVPADNAPVDAAPVPVPVSPAPAPTTPPALPTDTASPVAPPAPTSVGAPEINVAARGPGILLPKLNPTDNEIRAEITEGRNIGKSKRDFIDLIGATRVGFQFRPGGILGEKRRETGIAIWLTPTVEARWRGFLEQRHFADAAKQAADFTDLQQIVTSPHRTLTFLIEVNDLFQKSKDQKHSLDDPSAAFAKLDGTKFVLSDDMENNYTPISVTAAPHLIVREGFYQNLAADPSLIGDPKLFDVSAPTTDYTLVQNRPNYSDLAGFFVVTFDAFNADGTARVNRDTKTITLHVVLPSGSKAATYTVAKLP